MTITPVIDHFAPRLKAAGWRKRGSTFNRRFAGGVVHVISFQQGRWETPQPDTLYGRFTVNLGITLADDDGFVSEPRCRFRARIGTLLDEPADPWWSLDDRSLAIAELEPLFARAFELLDTMQTPIQLRDAAASPVRAGPHWWGRNRLLAATIDLSLGDRDAAQRHYSAHFADDNYELRAYQTEFAAEHGLRVPWFPVSRLGLRLRARRAELDEHRRWDDFDRRNPESARPKRSLLARAVRWARA